MKTRCLFPLLAALAMAGPAKSEPNLTATLEICTRYASMSLETRAEEISAQGWTVFEPDLRDTGEYPRFAEYKFRGTDLESVTWALSLRLLDFRNINKSVMHECRIDIPIEVDPAPIFSLLEGETRFLEATEAEFYGYSAEKLSESREVPQMLYLSTFAPASHDEAIITIRKRRNQINTPWYIEAHAWVPEMALTN